MQKLYSIPIPEAEYFLCEAILIQFYSSKIMQLFEIQELSQFLPLALCSAKFELKGESFLLSKPLPLSLRNIL